jgi:hypothetical protein
MYIQNHDQRSNSYNLSFTYCIGFNVSAPHCGGVYPADKDGLNATCFNHNWETQEARERLWASCQVPGREITRIFLSDIKSRVENNGLNSEGVCDSVLLATLAEAHERGVRVYALFAVSDAAFSETYMATYPNEFNAACGTELAYFDGVSVNNEYFSQIRDCDNPDNTLEQQILLDKLKITASNAAPLPLHFSVSWNWDCCSCSSQSYATRDVQWPADGGEIKSALHHMVDIVDSIDVQVAYNTPSAMISRSAASYDYWTQKVDKSSTSKVYALAYTNPTDLCQVSFSPHAEGSSTASDVCSIGNQERTEASMYAAFDDVETEYPLLKGGIHFMNGVYGSGITDGWPVHDALSMTRSCITNAPSKSTTVYQPSEAPSKTPHAQPTLSPIIAPPSHMSCNDSRLLFLYNKQRVVSCSWVAERPQRRCKRNAIKIQCPITCGYQEGCLQDSKRKFEIIESGKRRSCKWVQRKNTEKRCGLIDMCNTCRATCSKWPGGCQS